MKGEYRCDRISDDTGGMLVAWAFKSSSEVRVWPEYLVTLQALARTPDTVIHDKHCTHEVHIFGLSPLVSVDYGRNIFEQSGLRPLTPSTVGYQFRAYSDDEAVGHVSVIVEHLLDGSLDPDDPEADGWSSALPKAVPLRPSLVLEDANSQSQ